LVRGTVDLVVPAHRTVAIGTLKAILRAADMTADDLRKLL
jgi:predicted RNA binding protein YcfA (HicA-like mRNA interferase family)